MDVHIFILFYLDDQPWSKGHDFIAERYLPKLYPQQEEE